MGIFLLVTEQIRNIGHFQIGKDCQSSKSNIITFIITHLKINLRNN